MKLWKIALFVQDAMLLMSGIKILTRFGATHVPISFVLIVEIPLKPKK